MIFTGKTQAQVDDEAKRSSALARLAELDKALPRPLELVISMSPEAMAEVLDAQGTTRGAVLAEKQALRAGLAAVKGV